MLFDEGWVAAGGEQMSYSMVVDTRDVMLNDSWWCS